VQIQPVTPEIADGLGLKKPAGALVAEPQKDGPAVKAGIQSGDVITSVNDNPVADARDLARKIGGMAPGATVKLGVVRAGAEKTLSLTLGELPNQREARADTKDQPEKKSSNEPRLGLSLTPAAASRASSSPKSIPPVPPPISASRPVT
jgi:serine protease Do